MCILKTKKSILIEWIFLVNSVFLSFRIKRIKMYFTGLKTERIQDSTYSDVDSTDSLRLLNPEKENSM